MSDELPVTQLVVERISGPNGPNSIQTTSTDEWSTTSLFKDMPFVIDSSFGHNDLIMPKQTMIKMFVECRNLLRNDDRIHNDLEGMSATELEEQYFATLGILLVTPEDHTALTRNEEILVTLKERHGIVYHKRTLTVLSVYLSSNIARTNKSSSLWLYFKKLFIKLVNTGNNVLDLAVETVLTSIKYHPRSYYALSFLRFLIAISRNGLVTVVGRNNHGLNIIYDYFYNKVLGHCKTDINDYSMWMVLLQLLINVDDESFFLEEFASLGQVNKTTTEARDVEVDREKVSRCFDEILEWLDKSRSGMYSGWLCITVLSVCYLHRGVGENELLTKYWREFTQFERKNKLVIDVARQVLLNDDCDGGKEINLNEDLMLKEEFKILLCKKRLFYRYK